MQDAGSVNLYERRGGAVREFGLKPGHGTADYLLCVDQKAAGVVAAKAAGYTLTGVETHSGKYSCGLPENLASALEAVAFSSTRLPERRLVLPTCWTPNRAVATSSPPTRSTRWRIGLASTQRRANPARSV